MGFPKPAPSAGLIVDLAPPGASDAAPIWRLVEETGSLDGNSPYAYLLLCTHFADTGIVARAGSEVVGFVLGYVRPDDHTTAFVWQVGVAAKARGRGLGTQLLDAWFARCARGAGVSFLEATVTPSNRASHALFASFALRKGAALLERLAFDEAHFPPEARHEEEVAVRIGPVSASRALASSDRTGTTR